MTCGLCNKIRRLAPKLGMRGLSRNLLPSKYILRVPDSDDSLKPYQIRHVVALLKFMKEHHENILVQEVFACIEGEMSREDGFIAMEYIDEKSLNQMWSSYSDEEKDEVSRNVAELLLDMCKIWLEQLGAEFVLGSTVEVAI